MPDSERRVMDFTCSTCNKKVRRRTTVFAQNHYCSQACRSKGLVGKTNPNYKAASNRVCKRCGSKFQSYQKARIYCTAACYHLSRQPPPPPPPPAIQHAAIKCKTKPKRVRVKYFIECKKCSKVVRRNKSEILKRKRQYCSYECFVNDGGTKRAGHAAAEAIMKKYGAKKDANHKEIMAAIGALVAVHDLSHAGYGVPDGAAYIKGGWQLFDIKNPDTSYGRKGLNQKQKEWAKDWRGGPIYLIYTVDEAIRFAMGNFDGLKMQKSGYMEGLDQ